MITKILFTIAIAVGFPLIIIGGPILGGDSSVLIPGSIVCLFFGPMMLVLLLFGLGQNMMEATS